MAHRSCCVLALVCLLLLAPAQAATSVNIQGILDTIATAELMKDTVANSASAAVSTMTSAALAANNAMINNLGPIASTVIAPVYKRAADIELLAADMDRNANIDIGSFVSNIQATLSTRTASQVAYRMSVTNAVNAMYASDSAMMMGTFSAATAMRTQLKTDASNNRASIQTLATSTIAAATANENTRATSDLSRQTAQISTTNAQLSSALSQAIVNDAVRATTACNSRAVALQGSIPPQSGSNDFASCLSSQAGQAYFSTTNQRPFVCDGSFWGALPLYSAGFSDSTILNRAQAAALTHHLNQGSIWTNCWRGSQQATFGSGSASSTFHSLCNNKGPTVTIAKTTGGRIAGGYTDAPWTSRGSYVQSWEAFLYRFNPTNTNSFERSSLYYGGGYNYATYDGSSYCTTFGNGHDWYLDSTCKTGYFNVNYAYYFAQGTTPYDQNWLFGSYSSWTLAEHEVYYLSK